MPVPQEEAGLPGIFQYDHPSQVPAHLQKYWHQRHKIFSKYDEGIWMTDNAWYEVTPEPIANKIATHVSQAAPRNKTVIIDAFAGVGANAIAFALSGRWSQVFAIEKDETALMCAKHNAELYGVHKKIFWIKGDCFTELKRRFSGAAAEWNKKAVIFASPPWGGPEYSADDIFDLSLMEPYSLEHIHTAFTKITPEIVLYLPRNSDLNQIDRLAPKESAPLPVHHYCVNYASKALCAYFGSFDLVKCTYRVAWIIDAINRLGEILDINTQEEDEDI